jgi:hypothetical protein
LRCVRIYSDGEGESHFEDVDIELQATDYAPPAEPLMVSVAVPASSLALATFPLGWDGSAWHASPRRQYFVFMSGTLEVSVSDGESRLLGDEQVCGVFVHSPET